MKSVKKIALLALSFVLVAALAVGTTLAFLQDSDGAVNVMTIGNVKIKQLEYERGASGLQTFTQGLPLDPAVTNTSDFNWLASESLTVEGHSVKLWDSTKVSNVRDKIVLVKNTGISKAYLRTWFAFELGDLSVEKWTENFHTNCNTDGISWEWGTSVVPIGDSNFVLACATYDQALSAGQFSAPSLLQYALAELAGNDTVASFGGTYDILVISQAVQTSGFASAEEALNKAFTENHPFSTLIGDLTQVYSGVTEPLTLSGNGTVVLNNVTIDASNTAQKHAILLENFNGTIVILGNTRLTGAKGGSGIYVASGSALKLSGAGSLTVIGNAGAEFALNAEQYSTTADESFAGFGGSGIGVEGNGEIHISDLASLTAKGYGAHAFGIGSATASVTIENTLIEAVRGGFVNQNDTYEDPKYNKSEPEGGAAIGGSSIVLTNVEIIEAIGGSKAAGIGAHYHCPTTISITDCVIKNVVGGASSAGIGGSRVNRDGTSGAITITIQDSDIYAVGGYFGAGIGSGYDTHCSSTQPAVIINISGDASHTITAKGGKYAAGIGTGFHNAQLSGEISGDIVIRATSGDNFYKDTYTKAQDIGFGVVDPEREAKNNTSEFRYNHTVIVIPVP